MKAESFSLENKGDFQRRREMKMTPAERWSLAFELIELARVFSPEQMLEPAKKDSINWIELKLKNDLNKRDS